MGTPLPSVSGMLPLASCRYTSLSRTMIRGSRTRKVYATVTASSLSEYRQSL
jgi:hypothetical protein